MATSLFCAVIFQAQIRVYIHPRGCGHCGSPMQDQEVWDFNMAEVGLVGNLPSPPLPYQVTAFRPPCEMMHFQFKQWYMVKGALTALAHLRDLWGWCQGFVADHPATSPLPSKVLGSSWETSHHITLPC